MKLISLLLVLAAPGLPLDAASLPEADAVVAKMMAHDAERQASLSGYTAMRRYVLDNRSRHADMVVRATILADGSKQFSVIEENGTGSIRKQVLHRIIPQNYSFQSLGTETVNSRPAYVLDLTPKTQNKYLIAWKIWVDAEEYAI